MCNQGRFLSKCVSSSRSLRAALSSLLWLYSANSRRNRGSRRRHTCSLAHSQLWLELLLLLTIDTEEEMPVLSPPISLAVFRGGWTPPGSFARSPLRAWPRQFPTSVLLRLWPAVDVYALNAHLNKPCSWHSERKTCAQGVDLIIAHVGLLFNKTFRTGRIRRHRV